jgi:predicted secreted protein|tara:strand:- start:438 stop:638 length:201 start_codon:yes stop_codon:yes gene_type:complete
MKFLFLLFIIWWVIFMTILPIKRSDFEEGMPKKSYLGIKFLVSFALSMVVSYFIIKYENNIFEYFK